MSLSKVDHVKWNLYMGRRLGNAFFVSMATSCVAKVSVKYAVLIARHGILMQIRSLDWMFKLSGTEEVEYKGDKFRYDISTG